MVSKKLLLMTLVMLSCIANSSFGMDQEQPNPERYAQDAFNDEAAGKPRKGWHKRLFISRSRRLFRDRLYEVEFRQEVLRNLEDRFDAAYKKIENDRYEKTRAAHLAACPAEDKARPVLKLRKTIDRQTRSRSSKKKKENDGI